MKNCLCACVCMCGRVRMTEIRYMFKISLQEYGGSHLYTDGVRVSVCLCSLACSCVRACVRACVPVCVHACVVSRNI